MFVPPIIERELRIALRNRQAVKSRFHVAAGAAALVGIFWFFSWLGGSSGWGRALHTTLFVAGLYLSVVPPARVSVGLFCEERRNQTLELLYLAGLGSGELFLEKLLGGVLIASGDLLALAPFLAVPFLSGGVSLDLFLATIGCFPVLLLFTVSVGVLASVLCRDEGAALVCAVILGGTVCLAVTLPYYLGASFAGAAPYSAGWLRLSPAYAAYLAGMDFAGGSPRLFWETAGVTVGWSLIFLGTAAVFLNRNWREEMVRSAPDGWRGGWSRWLHGSVKWRRELRAEVLPGSAFQWLAQRDRRPVLVAWALMGGIIALWLLGWAAWRQAWPTPANLYLAALLMILGSILTVRYAAARTIGTERREGTLELLLTTPLSPEQMVAGQLAAVRAQFRPVRIAMLGWFGLMMIGGFFTRAWTNPALIEYIVIWFWLIVWSQFIVLPDGVSKCMWIALNTGRPASAILLAHRHQPQQSRFSRYFWIYIMLNPLNSLFLMGSSGFPSGSYAQMIFVSFFSVWGCVAVGTTLFKAKNNFSMSKRMIKEMRWVTRQPVPDSKHSRYKKWSCLDPKPLAAGLTFQMEPMRAAEPGWFQKLGGAAGRQMGKGWVNLRERRRSRVR